MRHQKKTLKLGLTAEHRKALLANQVCSLIEHERIKTTLAKAKAVRKFDLAEWESMRGVGGALESADAAAVSGAVAADRPPQAALLFTD